MRIEKIANPVPGLYEIFLDPTLGQQKHNHYTKFFPQYIHSVYGDLVKEYLDQHDVTLVSRQPTIMDVLLSADTDTRFEISARYLKKVPSNQLKKLCGTHKLLITDLFENGAELGELLSRSPWLKFRDAVFIDSGGNKTIMDYQGNCHPTPQNVKLTPLPMFLYYTVSRYLHKGLTKSANDMSKNLLVPCMKPHEHRILLLSILEDADLLEHSDWSLGYDPDSKALQSYNIEYTDHRVNNFITAHRQELPRFLSQADYTGTRERISEVVSANHRWHIVSETFTDRIDLTEKVFQAFMCMNPPLIVAGVGFNSALRDLGFNMSLDYEHHNTEQQINNIVHIINTQYPDLTEAKFNQQHCCDLDHWSQYFVQTLAAACK